MAFTASGCTLAVPEAGTDGNGDRLIGAFITSEYLDLYDMEGYLNDHAASLMNNSSITIGNDKMCIRDRYLSGKVQELFRICKEFYRCRSFLVSVQIIY